jgi:hypothetical protein
MPHIVAGGKEEDFQLEYVLPVFAVCSLQHVKTGIVTANRQPI